MKSLNKLDLTYDLINLLDVADVVRADGNIYPENTIYIQVSASPRCGLKQFKILDKAEKLESKYAIIKIKNDIDPRYLYITLTREEQEWRSRYTGDNINIQMDSFKYMKINIHRNKETQKLFIDMNNSIEKEIEYTEKLIEETKKQKNICLTNYFAKQNKAFYRHNIKQLNHSMV